MGDTTSLSLVLMLALGVGTPEAFPPCASPLTPSALFVHRIKKP
jgi:hypothetical protein